MSEMVRNRMGGVFLIGWGVLGAATVATGQNTSSKSQDADVERMQLEMEQNAKSMGPWEQQHRWAQEATDNIFQKQGWNSESDNFARDVLRDVDQVPPWNYQERQNIFMGRVQARYSLSEDQKKQLSQDMQREAMMVAIKHFKTTAPIAMEIIATRSRGEAFTPEMVQRWSQNLDPVLMDARGALERIAARLSTNMTDEQRAILDRDLKATLKRHEDVVHMVRDWKEGKWSPEDWGLQNDPIHATEMAEIRAKDDEKTVLANRAIVANQNLEAIARPTDESSWAQYVRQFNMKYHCDEVQQRANAGILQDQEGKARNYRDAHKDKLAELQKQSTSDVLPAEAKQAYARDLEKTLAPIADMFDILRRRLDSVLRSDQRSRYGAMATTAAPSPQP